MQLTLKITAAVLTLAVSIVAGLRVAQVWNPQGPALVVVILAAGLVAFMSSVASAIQTARGTTRSQLEHYMRQALFPMVIGISTARSVPAADLGFAAYVVRRRWMWPRKVDGHWVWHWLPRTLLRLDRHRPSGDSIGRHGTLWLEGKGVIGACVGERKKAWADVGAIWPQTPVADVAAWLALPDATRMGLSFGEYLRLHANAGVVIAVPLIFEKGQRRTVKGVVAIDAPSGTLANLVPSADVDRYMGDAVTMFRRALSRKLR